MAVVWRVLVTVPGVTRPYIYSVKRTKTMVIFVYLTCGGADARWRMPMRYMVVELAALWLLARAVALPWIGSRRRLKPVVVGMVEMISSLLVFIAVVVQ